MRKDDEQLICRPIEMTTNQPITVADLIAILGEGNLGPRSDAIVVTNIGGGGYYALGKVQLRRGADCDADKTFVVLDTGQYDFLINPDASM